MIGKSLEIPFGEFEGTSAVKLSQEAQNCDKMQIIRPETCVCEKNSVPLRSQSAARELSFVYQDQAEIESIIKSFEENKTNNTMTFTEAKAKFDAENGSATTYTCFLPEHLTLGKQTNFRKTNGSKNEQYYKWQFLYALVSSGLFAKDYIGTEVQFPKGNKSSAAIKLDGAIFDDKDWFEKYRSYHQNNDADSLDWLRKHLIVALEFKKEDNKNVAEVWDKQLKAYMKESEREFCLGMLYDTERLYLFRKHNNNFLRYNEEYNTKGSGSKTADLSLHLPDPYCNIPNFDKVVNWAKSKGVNRAKRKITNLEVISGIQSTQINDAMSAILRTLDTLGMVNQTGFEILVQILALKIFDEKRNEKQRNVSLDFYILPEEKKYNSLADEDIQKFITRMQKLRNDAKGIYYRIFQNNVLDFKNEKHIQILIEVVSQFQDFSFVLSQKTDLYQLVFYQFAGKFSKDQNAQFITPLPLIDFLVNLVNPRSGETVIDPTVGIADFLSVSYVNSHSKLDDKNIFGMDIDDQMVMLATLNMLLNGDGNAKIVSKTDGYGSLLNKFGDTDDAIELVPNMNKNGQWDNRPDNKQIKKFDVVLTNPPFGENRAYTPKTSKDREVAECYELWNQYQQNKIDKGILFLENAYRILKENGRIGIVLSNSIASIDSHQIARQWLMEHMRIVALFDMPANVFAETGVNTTVIVAYKPSDTEFKRLKESNYEIFVRDIKKVGYEVKTVKRVKKFSNIYKINYDTFETEIDENGNAILDEDFTCAIKDFRQWCKTQEHTLQDLFIKEK